MIREEMKNNGDHDINDEEDRGMVRHNKNSATNINGYRTL